MLVYFEIEEALDRIVIVEIAAEKVGINRERRLGIKDIINPENKLSTGE